ncbi:hypothetical protein A1O7_00438 [Cladophialophora yegresii CBS 114405]|uniref:K Homology domain-containing protein n=1 Tax=Cladophialophora yegresii CBS 114405 TaxID=1182544 RepID=W9W7M7_9EURO|nr:uncharacterized protein A1O7_00438 [Cladophialophora yegresii CBS 114405]EXJ64102.1 hypothetical protein A1O7_00438 [Cladophialophora yegresii CBS 114405]
MATASVDAVTDGGSSTTKTPAQLMQEQHEAAEAHRRSVTVEDVPDEDDIQHPPPPHHHVEETDASKTEGSGSVPLSEKAAGKQKASDKPPVLDTQSEEAFPALGAATKSAAATSARPISYANLSAKGAGANGSPALGSRPTSSGAPTPTSTPGARTPVPNPAARAGVLLPGRARDSFEIDNADLDKTKSLPRVFADVKKKFNVTVATKSANFGRGTEFIAEGPKNRVTEALMYVSKELTLEKQVRLEIPSTVSAQVIGRGGANIKKLETQFNVRIRIDRDTKPVANPDDVKTDVVEIRGNAAQVRQVYEQISNQVKSLQPKVDLPVRGIPPEFYPFIAGRHADRLQQMERERDLRINVPRYHTWHQQPPPRPAQAGQRPVFVPHGDDHIVVSGDQAAALEARLMIEQLAGELQKELLLEELVGEQILHPYIVGERGMDPLQFLEQTGCAVVLPPSHHETEDYHIIGPRDRLEAGRNLAEQLMSQKYNRAVDLQKHFHDAPQGPERHSRALAQYLQQKAIEREFMNSHGAEIIFPQGNNASSSWNVITNDQKNATSAGNELRKIAQAFPSSRIGLVEVDPFFHPHLERMHSSNLRENLGVHLIVPEDGSEPVILVYEGPSQDENFSIPRTKPSQDDVATFEKALQEAQAALLSNIPHQGISVQDIHVPKKFQDKVKRFVNNEPKPAPPQSFPVQVDFGARGGARQSNGVSRGSPSERVYLRGPSEADIAELRRKIEEFLQEAEQDEKERGYTTSFAFPAQYNKNLIGKQGTNIKALREKHDVEIDTREDGKITIKGPQKKAEACKAEIQRLGKQWEDEVNFAIKIDPKYHGMLVGRSGENLQKIQNKVDNAVRIDFPKAAKISDDASVADNASEVGASRGQPHDEVRIRGPRAKAEKVRDELLSLHQYLVDNSHTANVSVAQGQIASLIGRRGQEMEKLRADTGAQIDIPKADGSDRVTIQIKGTKQQVEKARQELQKRSKAFDDVVTRVLKVDRKHHRALIGSGGANIQSIVSNAGGTGTSAEHVRFPRQGEESDDLTIKGTADVVEKILAAIQSFVDEREKQITETVDVPVSQHRELIGPNGSTRKKLEEQFGVTLNVPRQGSGQTGVKIAGRAENVAKAKEHIQGLTSKPTGETIMIPRALHHTISRNGALFRELARDGIRVDHNGQKPPPKPATNRGPRARTTNGDMPLITDQPGDEQSYSWEIVSNQDELKNDAGKIPWVILAGKDASDDAVAKTKEKIQSMLEKASEPQHTGYLILPDPRLHRHIIGQGGSTINSIRRQSGCDIQVPNRNSGKGEEGEAITIVGEREGVESARDLILDAIKNANSGRDSPRGGAGGRA